MKKSHSAFSFRAARLHTSPLILRTNCACLLIEYLGWKWSCQTQHHTALGCQSRTSQALMAAWWIISMQTPTVGFQSARPEDRDGLEISTQTRVWSFKRFVVGLSLLAASQTERGCGWFEWSVDFFSFFFFASFFFFKAILRSYVCIRRVTGCCNHSCEAISL